jgi:tetratricopeptide (TPR) repeat protein
MVASETNWPTPLPVVPEIWGNVPQRNKNFTGRNELLEQLRQHKDAVERTPQALQGLGGVGKTAVAVEYAHRFSEDYDLVWWIPSDQPTLVRSALAALARPMHLDGAAASGIESAAAAVLDALRRGDPYRRWLLIFDNADQPDELNQIIPRGPGDVLITSRNLRWQAVIDTIPVDVFKRAESVEFLTRRAPKALDPAAADLLSDKLGDLPLALEQAGALLAETGLPVEDYIRLLDEKVSQIMAEGKGSEYPMSMTAAWKLSVSRLRQVLPEAQELLRCCAFFGADPIPRDVFRRGAQTTGTRISELIANPILLASAIRELGRFALIKLDGQRISVHRLSQALIRDELNPAEQSGYRHDVHAILATGTPKNPSESGQWPLFGDLVSHVSAPVTDLAGCQITAHRVFALTMVRYLYLTGDLAACQELAERFIKGWTADSGSRERNVLDAKRHLGNVLRQLGRYPDAYAINRDTLSIAEDSLGTRDGLTLSLRNTLGADMRALGDFAAARALDERTRELHAEVFGPTDPHTLRVMNNLALDHLLNSDYRAARDLHQRVYLLQSEAAAGVSTSEVLSSWNSLAWDVRLCGDLTAARDVTEDAWEYGKERLGPEHYQTLRTANAFAIALRELGTSNSAAMDLASQVLDQCRRLYGDSHPDTLAAAINLANIQRAGGRPRDALELAEATVTRYPGVYGKDHPYSHACAGTLALLRRITGDPAGARALNETALAGLDRRLNRDHHYSLIVAANLASDLAQLGETAAAPALGEDTLDRSRRLLGEDHPMTLGCAANLVLDLRVDGSAAERADHLAADTMTRYARTLGTAHPDVQRAAAGQRIDFDFDPPAI